MGYKKLKINRELISNSVLKATNKDIKPTETQNSGIKIHRYKVNTNSILDIYFNQDGTTSMICSGKEPELAELVASDIKDNCEVNLPEPTRALYLRGFTQEKFDTIIQRFKSHNLTVSPSEDTAYAKRYTISNTTDESIKVHYFPSTGALNFQGRGYTIYSDLLEGMEDWVTVDEVIDSNLAANKIESITKEDLVKSMKDALPNSYDFLNGAIANIMSSSFFLTKIENAGLPDYSWMVFPILRGLEGAIKKMLILKGISINKNFGEVFEPVSTGSTTYKFLVCHSTAINDIDYCNLLTNCYNYICANRHGIFHVNGVINSTRMLTRENAIEMFNEIIELIEDTYSKVKPKSGGMSEAFEILNTDSDKYPLIVVAKNYLGLSDYISELENILRRNKFKGKVIFDFLLSNGFRSDNRFMCSSFDGSGFHELHKYPLDSRNNYLIEKLKKFYFSNQEILSKGILSKNEILIIKTTHNIVYK